MNKYQPVIGLEVHVELKTNSKMFCGCSADYFGHEPNTHTCPVCLGLPGTLPVPNKKAIEWCVLIGLALNCEIPLLSKFDRKNYFYPDLAKGYQISQYDQPFAINGYVILGSETTPGSDSGHIRSRSVQEPAHRQARMTEKIRIRRVHMEEDTGKLTHATVDGKKVSLIDFNRSGVPLVEIVTEPDFRSSQEVVEYLKKLQQIMRYLGVSNADMEKGDMRLEPNISLKPVILATQSEAWRRPESSVDAGQAVRRPELTAERASMTDTLPPYKVEVKNINSFRFVEKAIEFEIKRQAEILDRGETPIQETRGFVEPTSSTKSQRIKEEANDYRYFPEPDIPPIRWKQSRIDAIESQMPEMPEEKLERFMKEYQLPKYDSALLTREKETADYFDEAALLGREQNLTPKQIANILINKKVDTQKILPAELIKMVLSATQVDTVDDEELGKVIDQVIQNNQKAVQDYKNGKESVILFLVGQVMRMFKTKIDAQLTRQKLAQKLS